MGLGVALAALVGARPATATTTQPQVITVINQANVRPVVWPVVTVHALPPAIAGSVMAAPVLVLVGVTVWVVTAATPPTASDAKRGGQRDQDGGSTQRSSLSPHLAHQGERDCDRSEDEQRPAADAHEVVGGLRPACDVWGVRSSNHRDPWVRGVVDGNVPAGHDLRRDPADYEHRAEEGVPHRNTRPLAT
jgi:hypothetical protein